MEVGHIRIQIEEEGREEEGGGGGGRGRRSGEGMGRGRGREGREGEENRRGMEGRRRGIKNEKLEPWFHSWYRYRVEILDAKFIIYMATPIVQRELPKYEIQPPILKTHQTRTAPAIIIELSSIFIKYSSPDTRSCAVFRASPVGAEAAIRTGSVQTLG